MISPFSSLPMNCMLFMDIFLFLIPPRGFLGAKRRRIHSSLENGKALPLDNITWSKNSECTDLFNFFIITNQHIRMIISPVSSLPMNYM